MSRLLFAAARRARVEKWVAHHGEWQEARHFNGETDTFYRIHPEDVHLAFGPISTALREEAALCYELQPLVYDASYGTWGIAIHDWYKFRACDDELHRSIFLLILAEALADEGL